MEDNLDYCFSPTNILENSVKSNNQRHLFPYRVERAYSDGNGGSDPTIQTTWISGAGNLQFI